MSRNMTVKLSPYEQAINRLNDLPLKLDRIFSDALEDLRRQRDEARAETEQLHKEVDSGAAHQRLLLRERDEARERLKQLEAWRDGLQEYLLNWRGVALGEECYACGGSGVRSYPNTTMWRGGYGGQATTSGVCDGCWGSGGGVSKGWVNLRVLESKLDRMARMDKLVAAVLESAESAPPGSTLKKLVLLAKSLNQDPNLP